MMIASTISGRFGAIHQINYNAELAELTWQKGVPLILLDSGDTLQVLSGDGKVRDKFDGQTAREFITPQKVLIGSSSLYYSTADGGSKLVENSGGRSYSHLSLSPQQDFLEYDLTGGTTHCISTFNYTTLGPCVDITTLLPHAWDWSTEAYIDTGWDSNWDKTTDNYIIRVRSKLDYDLVPSGSDNVPPVRVQRELARFSYDPTTSTLSSLPLDQSITLKTPDIFLTDVDKPLLNYFQPGSDIQIIYNHPSTSIGITQLSTKRSAKLTDASFMGDIPAFDVVTFRL